jgi:hypothetical protein
MTTKEQADAFIGEVSKLSKLELEILDKFISKMRETASHLSSFGISHGNSTFDPRCELAQAYTLLSLMRDRRVLYMTEEGSLLAIQADSMDIYRMKDILVSCEKLTSWIFKGTEKWFEESKQ